MSELSVRVAQATQTPWRTVYYDWPAGLVLALAVVVLEQDRDRAREREQDRRTLALYTSYAYHDPKQLGLLPPLDRPTAAQVQADVAAAAARLAAATPELPDG